MVEHYLELWMFLAWCFTRLWCWNFVWRWFVGWTWLVEWERASGFCWCLSWCICCLTTIIIVVTISFLKTTMLAVTSIDPGITSFSFCCNHITSYSVFIVGFHPWCFFICVNVVSSRSLIITTLVPFISITSFDTTQLTKVIVFQKLLW